MRIRPLLSLLSWVVALTLVGGLLALAYAFHGIMRDRRGLEAGGENAQESKHAGNNVVKLGAELAESHGLREEAAQDVEWHQRIPAYGRVVPNPRALAEVRAPFAGTLRAAPSRAWPALGSRLEAGDVLGWLDIRVGPQERLDLEIKLREARVKFQGAEEVFKIQQERVQRFQTLEAPGAVSRADLDQALVQLADARTQMATAKAAVQQWEDALAEINQQGERQDTTWSQPLKAPASGEIIDLAGRPGMALEAGGLVARVVDFRRALVRLDIPARALAGGPPSEVELFASGDSPPAFEGATNRPEPGPAAQSVRAELAGAAPQLEASSQFAGYWYEVDTASASEKGTVPLRRLGGGIWRPGLFVKAFLTVPETKPRHAVTVPETALLYHQGRALVYVRLAPGKFERREVQILGREPGRWVLASGVTPGELVVSRRAQVLLSEEFRSAADND
jgi:RND family efflux transporter MFP subunit